MNMKLEWLTTAALVLLCVMSGCVVPTNIGGPVDLDVYVADGEESLVWYAGDDDLDKTAVRQETLCARS